MIQVNKAFFLADGEFGVRHIMLPELTIPAVLNNLGISRIGPMDRAEVKDGDVMIELAQKTPWTYNRYIFTLRKV